MIKLTWLLVGDVAKQEEDEAEGDEGCPPFQHEHKHNRDDSPNQCYPVVVVPEGWPPACGGQQRFMQHILEGHKVKTFYFTAF